MSATRHPAPLFLAGALMALWAAPQAQAQLRHWHRPQPHCIDELAKPPTLLDKPPTVPEKKADEPPPEVAPELAPRTTAALGDVGVGIPQMMGDFGGYCGFRTVTIPVLSTIVIDSDGQITRRTRIVNQQVTVCDPIASRAGSGFKVADNTSPKPTDRVFFTYNYFDNLRAEGGSVPRSITTRETPSFIIVRTAVPGATVTPRPVNVQRELFGFEKTFLGGDASVELRLPLFQTDAAADALSADDFGDLTVVTRYACLNDPVTGNVFSVGLAVTAPTGPAINTIAGDINSTLIQPWFGYIGRAGNFYFQGIHAMLIPTDSEDVTLLFNDLSTGYIFACNRRAVAFWAPNFEVHITTPLEGHDSSSAVRISDIVNLTGGVHIGLCQGRTLLSFGVATPVTGPRPMDLEGFVQLNFRF